LRSPLTSVIGNGMLLLKHGGALSPSETEECLQDIVSGGERLQRTIENLLLLTRLEAGQTLDSEPISLTNIVDRSIEMFSKKNPSRQVEIDVVPDMPDALGEGTLIALVLENLVSNADKYSPKDRPIRVSLERTEGDEIQIRISDYGVGVAEEDMEYLFAPFYRSDWARNHAKGMGLGLAVCKRIMEAHNGRIWVERRAEGGSDFIFTLRSAATVGV
jgi:two-component system sensor histidine kinase KdpD